MNNQDIKVMGLALASQMGAVFLKNLLNHLSNKKKVASELMFPLFISLIYYFYSAQSTSAFIQVSNPRKTPRTYPHS